MKERISPRPTDRAGHDLGRLCKHLRRTIPVDGDANEGQARFPLGECHLRAKPQAPILPCRALDPASLDRLQAVLERHVGAFSWPQPSIIEWQEGAPSTDSGYRLLPERA